MVKLTKPVTIFRLKYTEEVPKKNGARVYGKLPEVTISIESEKIQTEEDMYRLFSPIYHGGSRCTFPHPIFQIMEALQKGKTKIVVPWQEKSCQHKRRRGASYHKCCKGNK